MILSLSGCSTIRDIRFSHHIVSIDEISLDEVVAAVQISPSYSSYEFYKGGYIAFIKYDGSYNLVKIGPMANGTPLWNDNGLVYFDTDFDHLLMSGKKPIERKNHKEGTDQTGNIVESNGRYFGVYNVGFDGKGGYTYELGIADEKKSCVYTLPYFFTASLATCGGKVLIVTEEHMIDGSNDVSPNSVYELREFNLDNGEGAIIAQHDTLFNGEKVEMTHYGSACIDDTNYVVPSFAENWNDIFAPVLDTWNSETGERTIIPLTTENGTDFNDSEDLPVPLFVEGDYFYGVEVTNGRISKVNTKTGVAVHLNKAELGSEEVLEDGSVQLFENYNFTTTYSNGFVYQLVFTADDYANPYIRTVDIRTGEEKKLLTVPGLGTVVSDLPYTGLAVNPHINLDKVISPLP